MNNFITTTVTKQINVESIEEVLEKQTFLHSSIWVGTTNRYSEEVSKIEITFSHTLCNYMGNEIGVEFETEYAFTVQDVENNSSFLEETIKDAEARYKAFYMEYAKKEVMFLLGEIKKWEED